MSRTEAAARGRDGLFVASLAKGLRLMRAFDRDRTELGLTELAACAGLDKSATQRLAATLHAEGFLDRDAATKRYRPSHRWLELANAYLRSDPLVALATPRLIELARTLGETINMAEASGDHIIYVARIPCQRTQFAATLIGRRAPALNTSSGRAMLSLLPEADRKAAVAAWPVHRYTPRTTMDREALAALVEEAAAQGWAFSRDELVLNEIGVAAPIRRGDGRPAAAAHCSISALRWSRSRVEREIAPALLDAANAISTRTS